LVLQEAGPEGAVDHLAFALALALAQVAHVRVQGAADKLISSVIWEMANL
jgi:hypothetical protein